MKTLLLSLTLLLFSNIASADWWDDAKEKAASIMEDVKDKSAELYDDAKDYIYDNKDELIDSGMELYNKAKGGESEGDDK